MRFSTGLIRPRATVLGNEFAGVVEAVGRDVTSFAVGDRVFGYNEGPFGGYAEYLSVPQDGSLATMPAGVTYQEAAPSTEGSHYALAHIRELMESGKFKPVIDRTYPLDQIVEAYRYVETGQKTGNVVISLEP